MKLLQFVFIGYLISIQTLQAQTNNKLVSLQFSNQKGNSFFAQIFGEPINYPSNINNGVGIFTAHLPKFYFIDLKDY